MADSVSATYSKTIVDSLLAQEGKVWTIDDVEKLCMYMKERGYVGLQFSRGTVVAERDSCDILLQCPKCRKPWTIGNLMCDCGYEVARISDAVRGNITSGRLFELKHQSSNDKKDPYAQYKGKGVFGVRGSSREVIYDPIPEEHQRIIDQFIKEHNEYVTNKAMVEMYSKLLKPKWYLSGTAFCIYTALAALVALVIWRIV